MEKKYINRPPRIQPELPIGKIQIPAPPSTPTRRQTLLQAALPLAMVAGYLLIIMLGVGRNPLFMIPMGMTAAASVGISLYNQRQAKQEEEQEKEAYAERLIKMRREMLRHHDSQRRFYLHNYPPPEESIQIANAVRHEHPPTHMPVTQRLWERRTFDKDFCSIRLGVGTRSSTVIYQFDGDDVDDAQTRLAIRLADDSRYVSNVPISIALRRGDPDVLSEEERKQPIHHAIGVTGNTLNGIDAFVAATLVNYVTWQSPNDAQLLILGGAQSRRKWQWVQALPHCQTHGMVCVEDAEDRQREKADSKVSLFLKTVAKHLSERQLRLRERDQEGDPTIPFLFVIIDLLGESAENTRLRDLETDPAIALLLASGDSLGAAVAFLTNEVNDIPSGCQALIEVTTDNPVSDDTTEHRTPHVMFRYSEIGINSRRYLGEADIIENPAHLRQFASSLNPLAVRKSYGASLPRMVHFLEMFQTEKISDMRRETQMRWQQSMSSYNADWLKATLGMLSGGEYRTLKFSADADGVHGMIAGSTGSGKSELLMTMILALAANYDPRIVNFVLVDYKGGGAFEPLKKLPHVVDVVTNLGESAVTRMFAAIQAELNRRSGINTSTNVKHIVEYREKNLHNLNPAPYPHLFIFIDEFAEMMQANPEFKAQLNSITRLGRAIGVTLILAAQRPTGVTDQMRANIKFRIALRVETPEESSEILRRRDAAYLPTGMPGRGYLQVGNEGVELMQVAWAGDSYTGELAIEEQKVIWKNRPKVKPNQLSAEPRRVYEEVTDMMISLADDLLTTDANAARPRKPWPDFLPERLSLQTPLDTYYIDTELLGENVRFAGIGQFTQEPMAPLNPIVREWILLQRKMWEPLNWQTESMRAVVGLIDNPYQRAQFPLLVDFRRGHAVILGASGWGKTTFLRTTLITLAATHAPSELHVYILDFGGRQLYSLNALPHVGDVVTPDNEEQVKRLLRRLGTELERRKRHFGEHGVTSQWAFNAQQTDPQKRVPSLLILIDNFAEFKESFEHLRDQLVSIAREGRAFGIHFIVSAESSSVVDTKLYGLLTERMTLRLSDSSEYSAIVGRGARVIDELEGRGLVKVGKHALEFQTALPIGSRIDLEQDVDHNRQLKMLITHFNDAVDQTVALDRLPTEIKVLQSRVTLDELLAKQPSSPQTPMRIQPLIGLDDFSLQPWALKLSVDGPQCVVVGAPFTGKTTLLRTIALSIAAQYRPKHARLILIDFQQRLIEHDGERQLSDLPHVIDAITRPEDMGKLIEQLESDCKHNAQLSKQERSPFFILIDNYISFIEEADKEEVKVLAKLERQFASSGLHFVIAGSPDIYSTRDDLRRQIQNSRFAIALDTDSIDRLGGRIPGSLRATELPPGRGFVVKSSRTRMVQFATPYENDESIEIDLDRWIEDVIAQYPNELAEWQTILPQTEDESPGDPDSQNIDADPKKKPVSSSPPPPPPPQDVYIPSKAPIPQDVDIAALTQEIADKLGFSIDMVKIMMKTDLEVYNAAVKYGLVDPPKAE